MKGVILCHENAQPHTAGVTLQQLMKFGWEALEHPPCSPDLSPCNFHMSGELKKCFKGQRFSTDDEIHKAVVNILCQLPQSFYEDAINMLVRQWDKSLTLVEITSKQRSVFSTESQWLTFI
jgi:histone-lysine N-methyltransferase SETMAR